MSLDVENTAVVRGKLSFYDKLRERQTMQGRSKSTGSTRLPQSSLSQKLGEAVFSSTFPHVDDNTKPPTTNSPNKEGNKKSQIKRYKSITTWDPFDVSDDTEGANYNPKRFFNENSQNNVVTPSPKKGYRPSIQKSPQSIQTFDTDQNVNTTKYRLHDGSPRDQLRRVRHAQKLSVLEKLSKGADFPQAQDTSYSEVNSSPLKEKFKAQYNSPVRSSLRESTDKAHIQNNDTVPDRPIKKKSPSRYKLDTIRIRSISPALERGISTAPQDSHIPRDNDDKEYGPLHRRRSPPRILPSSTPPPPPPPPPPTPQHDTDENHEENVVYHDNKLQPEQQRFKTSSLRQNIPSSSTPPLTSNETKTYHALKSKSLESPSDTISNRKTVKQDSPISIKKSDDNHSHTLKEGFEKSNTNLHHDSNTRSSTSNENNQINENDVSDENDIIFKEMKLFQQSMQLLRSEFNIDSKPNMKENSMKNSSPNLSYELSPSISTGEKDRLEAEIQDLKSQLSNIKNNQIQHEEENHVLQVEITNLKSKLSKAEEDAKQKEICWEQDILQLGSELERLQDNQSAELKEKSSLEAEMMKLRSELSNMQTSQTEREASWNTERQEYITQIENLTAQVSQREISYDDYMHYKERLKESEDYVATLERNIDDQLNVWQGEESTFQKQITTLRERLTTKSKEYKDMIDKYVQSEEILNQKMCEMTERLRKIEVENLDLKARFQEEQAKTYEMKATATTMNSSHMELEKKLRDEIESLREAVKKTHDESQRDNWSFLEGGHSHYFKEELTNAEFRFHMLESEGGEISQIKQETSNTSALSAKSEHESLMSRDKSEIDSLMSQVDKLSKEKQDLCNQIETLLNKESVSVSQEESLRDQISKLSKENKELKDKINLLCKNADHDDLQSENVLLRKENDEIKVKLDRLKKELNQSLTRLRNITIKSESQISDLRQREEEANRLVCRTKQIADKEVAACKNLEKELRKQIELLRRDRSLCKDSLDIIENVMKEESSTSDSMFRQLRSHLDKIDALKDSAKDSLHTNPRELGKTIRLLLHSFDELNLIIIDVEAAFKAEKAKVQNDLQSLNNAILSYEIQIEKLKNELAQAKCDVKLSESERNEEIKRLKQNEFDLLSKTNAIKGRYSALLNDFNEYKTRSESYIEKFRENEKFLLSDVTRLEKMVPKAPSDSLPPLVPGNLRMKLHGSPSGDLEMLLRDDDQSVTSIFSQNDVVNMREEIRHLKKLLNKSKADNTQLKSERDREKQLRELESAHFKNVIPDTST